MRLYTFLSFLSLYVVCNTGLVFHQLSDCACFENIYFSNGPHCKNFSAMRFAEFAVCLATQRQSINVIYITVC